VEHKISMDNIRWLNPIIDSYQKHFGNTAYKIIDVGSRDGDDAQLLLSKLGNNEACEVVCIEAREDAADEIKKNYSNFVVFPTAVSNFIGESKFVQMNDQEFLGSSSLEMVRATAYPTESTIINVPVTRLDAIIEPGIIDVLKIDVEGHSVPVIEGMGNLMKDVLVAHIETETPARAAWGEPSNNLVVMDIMQKLGFSLANVSYQWGWSIQDQTWVNTEHEKYRNDK
jgi:FkbM family methyltransferase